MKEKLSFIETKFFKFFYSFFWDDLQIIMHLTFIFECLQTFLLFRMDGGETSGMKCNLVLTLSRLLTNSFILLSLLGLNSISFENFWSCLKLVLYVFTYCKFMNGVRKHLLETSDTTSMWIALVLTQTKTAKYASDDLLHQLLNEKTIWFL